MPAQARSGHPAASSFAPPDWLLLLAGVIDALVQSIAVAWHEGALPAISPFAILSLAIGLSCLRALPPTAPPAPLAAGVFAAVLLVPSSLLAWAACVGYAAWLGWRERGWRRMAAGLVLATAAAAIWQAVDGRVLGLWLVLPDAIAAEAVLSLFRDGVSRDANLLGIAAGHNIVVLAGCATAHGLPPILVGAVATAVRARLPWSGRMAGALVGLTLLYATLNIARLALLGWSAGFYAWVHGDWGQNLFDTGLIALLFAFPGLLRRRAVQP